MIYSNELILKVYKNGSRTELFNNLSKVSSRILELLCSKTISDSDLFLVIDTSLMGVSVDVKEGANLSNGEKGFIEDLAAEISLDIDNISIWSSSSTHYHGRNLEGNTVLGLSESYLEDWSMAHELGHDFYAQNFGNVQRRNPETRNGSLVIAGNIDSNSLVESEIMAEMVAENWSDLHDPHERDPFYKSSEVLEEYQGLSKVSQEYDDIFTGLWENSLGTKGFKSALEQFDGLIDVTGAERRSTIIFRDDSNSIVASNLVRNNFDEIEQGYSLLKDLNMMTESSDIEPSNVLYDIWRRNAGKNICGESIIEQTVENKTPFDLSGTSFREIESEYGARIRNYLEDNTGEILEEVAQSAVMYIKSILESSERSQMPNPDHIVPVIQDDSRYLSVRTDYRHGVGCKTGIILSENGFTYQDMLENRIDLEELATYALSEGFRLGYQGKTLEEGPSIEDFESSIEYFLEEKNLI